MRYEVALKEKNVKKQDLSKTLQTKIDAIGKLVEKVHSAKTPEQAAAAKDDLDELDIEIARGIKKFNPEVHQRRLASIANINDKRAVEPKIEKKPKPQPIEKEVEIEQEDLEEQYKQEEESDDEVEQAPVRSARVERLEELQRKAREAQYLKYRQEELEQQRAQELDAEDEIKDFQKAKSVKPKGTSLSITLMGIGVFFLTWGTVNYFRTRKG